MRCIRLIWRTTIALLPRTVATNSTESFCNVVLRLAINHIFTHGYILQTVNVVGVDLRL
jgi:hypothetical protein